jgi:hypothetical protein
VFASLVAVVVVVLVVAGITVMIRRRSGDEVHSVEGYRSTLHTLEEVRTRSSAVRVLPRTGDGSESGVAAPDAAAGGEPPPGSASSAAGAAAGYRFGEDEVGAGAAEPSRFIRDTPRQRRRALNSMNHGPRRFAAPVIAGVLVLGAVAALAVVGAHTHRRPSGSTTTTHVGHTAAARHSGTTTAAAGRHAAGQHKASTTTTTKPPSYTAVSSTSTSATYVPPAPSYVLHIAASIGPCWVQVANTETGNVELSQTLSAGDAQPVSVRGTTTVELGAPGNVTIELDGTPVVLPSGYGTPFTLTFAPPPSGG